MTRSCWTQAWQISRTPFLHLTAQQLALRKGCGTIWHHAKVCQNGWHRHASLWFLCDVASMCRMFERSRKQVTFILAWEAGQIDQGSTASAALCNTSFGQDKSGTRWTNRHAIVHDWLWEPSARGASGHFSLTCDMYLHFLNFLSHPQALAFALASRKHPKFISIRLVWKVLQTNGDSGSAPISSTIWIRFWVFRTAKTSTCWCKSQGHHGKLTYLLRPFASFDGATACCYVNFGMVNAGARAPFPAETQNCGVHRITLKSPDWKSSLEMCQVESEVAWNGNPHKLKISTHFLRA